VSEIIAIVLIELPESNGKANARNIAVFAAHGN
jgi:hypothetical protein